MSELWTKVLKDSQTGKRFFPRGLVLFNGIFYGKMFNNYLSHWASPKDNYNQLPLEKDSSQSSIKLQTLRPRENHGNHFTDESMLISSDVFPIIPDITNAVSYKSNVWLHFNISNFVLSTHSQLPQFQKYLLHWFFFNLEKSWLWNV